MTFEWSTTEPEVVIVDGAPCPSLNWTGGWWASIPTRRGG